MLSNEFSTIPLADITIERQGRIRREIKAESITSLADSIARLGLLHPIVITRENALVAGETRLAACRLLGYDSIPFQYADTLDTRELLALELEENVKRSDLTWQEQCDAVARYHALQCETAEGWSVEKTADNLGVTRSHAYGLIQVAASISDPRVAAAPAYSTALGIVQRASERARSDALDRIGGAPMREESPIIVANFLEWVDAYTGPPFNLLHCDFPYGIGADKFNQGSAKSFGGYADTPEHYWRLVTKLIEQKEKLLGTSAHIIFWFSPRHYASTFETLSAHFWVDPYPLIWYKSDNTGVLPDPQRGPRRVYETAFFCSHGDRKVISPVSDVFAGPVQRTAEHMSEKSEDMLKHFMRMVVDENTSLLDPTCGSGSALRAASALGASRVLGLEMNEDFAQNARRAWEKRDA